jgi:hypothetical protein
VVVAVVGGDAPRSLSRPADLAADGRDPLDERDQLGDVVAVAPVSVQASGIPVASTRRWCFDPFLALSTGLGPVSEPEGFQKCGSVNIGRRRVAEFWLGGLLFYSAGRFSRFTRAREYQIRRLLRKRLGFDRVASVPFAAGW